MMDVLQLFISILQKAYEEVMKERHFPQVISFLKTQKTVGKRSIIVIS